MLTTLSIITTAAVLLTIASITESVTLSDLEYEVLDELEEDGGALHFGVLLRLVQASKKRMTASQLETVLIRLENKGQIHRLEHDVWCTLSY